MGHSVRKLGAVLACLLCVGAAGAQNVLSGVHHAAGAPDGRPFFDYGMTQGVFGAVAANTHSSFEPYVFSFQGGYHLESPGVSVVSAMHLARESVQLTGEGIWYPLVLERLRLGAGGTVNLNFDSVYAFELNVLPGAYVEYRPVSWFMLSGHLNYLFKGRAIYAVASDIGMLCNHTAALGFRLHFYVPGGFTLYAGGDADELFRYMILGVPSFTAGIAYTTGRFSFLVEANVRYIDFFTASATYEGTEVRALVEYRL